MTWRPAVQYPISWSPDLWKRGYRQFWWDMLNGRECSALLQGGDWWQP